MEISMENEEIIYNNINMDDIFHKMLKENMYKKAWEIIEKNYNLKNIEHMNMLVLFNMSYSNKNTHIYDYDHSLEWITGCIQEKYDDIEVCINYFKLLQTYNKFSQTILYKFKQLYEEKKKNNIYDIIELYQLLTSKNMTVRDFIEVFGIKIYDKINEVINPQEQYEISNKKRKEYFN